MLVYALVVGLVGCVAECAVVGVLFGGRGGCFLLGFELVEIFELSREKCLGCWDCYFDHWVPEVVG